MNAPRASKPEHVARQSWVTISTRRRSKRSAIAPPPNDPHTSGTACTIPSSPTSRAERVSEYTWNGTATRVICRPTREMSCPIHRRRNGRDLRSDRASTASVRNACPVHTLGRTGQRYPVGRCSRRRPPSPLPPRDRARHVESEPVRTFSRGARATLPRPGRADHETAGLLAWSISAAERACSPRSCIASCGRRQRSESTRRTRCSNEPAPSRPPG